MGKELISLDSSILIKYYRASIKDRTKLVELSREYEFSVSVIVKFEILVGAKTENEKSFWKGFFENLKILPLTEEDSDLAAKLMNELKRKNKIIGLKDTLIASSAITNGLKLATLNKKHFERIDGLEII